MFDGQQCTLCHVLAHLSFLCFYFIFCCRCFGIRFRIIFTETVLNRNATEREREREKEGENKNNRVESGNDLKWCVTSFLA